ncbi:MAG: DNA primase [Gammaproteobacteria bacterium]|nr:DNA primase [Gammaproteobacteria bacterium]
MTGKIPKSFIEDVLNRTDIVSLIDAYVPLRKKGANHMACCPFHQEKTPSFSVSSQKQIYYCFGCGLGGDAIRFLMEYEHLNFMEALEILAKQVGLALPQENKTYESSTHFYDVLNKTVQFYQQQLKNTKEAIHYLKSRGITGVLAKEYLLGFSPSAWDNLTSALGKDEQITQALLQTGLLIKKESGHVYDRFRSRIMFPIRDVKGRVIAFGGRVLIKEEPKYLNSPETPLFHKGRELYGLYEARHRSREIPYFIVVEGYMDVLALAQHGISYAVGTLGTATTAEHIVKLLKYTKKLVFCFDGDRAGRDAAWRALQVALPFLSDGVQLAFMFLPQEEDPDSFIRTQGKEAFLAEVKKAVSFADFIFRHLSESRDVSTLDGKASLSHVITPLIDKIPEGALKQLMYERLGRLLSLSTSQLRALSKKSHVEFSADLQKTKTATANSKRAMTHLTPLRLSMALLLQYPLLRDSVPASLHVIAWTQAESELFREILALLSAQPDASAAQLLRHWEDKPEYMLISELLMKEHFIDESELEKEFVQVLWRLEQQHHESCIEKMLMKARAQGLTSEERLALQRLIEGVKIIL